MELDEVIRRRRSTRAYISTQIDKEKLQRILLAATKGPSAGNLQAYEIFVITEDKDKISLSEAANGQNFLSEASACLIFCAYPERSSIKYGKRGQTLYSVQDATIAATFAILKAVDEGLSTAWVGAFNEERVKGIIKCKRSLPVAIIPIGVPGEDTEATTRMDLSDIVHFVK